MAVDPSIILSGQRPLPDVGDTITRALTVSSLLRERQAREEELRQAAETRQQAEQAAAFKLQQEQRAAATAQGTSAAVQAGWKQGEDGSWSLDRNAVTAGLLKVPGADVTSVLSHLDEADKKTADARKASADAEDAQQKANRAKLDVAGSIAHGIKAANYAPAAYAAGVHTMVLNKLLTDQEAQQHLAALQGGPQAIKSIVDTYIAKSDEQRKLAVSESEAATKAAAEAKPKPATEGELDAAAEALLTKQNMGQKLTPQESAALKAYQERKRTTTDAVAAAADRRQQQSEAFQRQESGRKAIQTDVEKPFVESKEKADLLRDVVKAAQGGNLTAAALQTLTTTLGLTSAEGVKRINAIELGQAAGAGTLWDRIKGRVGKLTAGQPLDAKLQADTLQLADLLEHSAAKKYLAAHASTTKRYGLTDEAPLDEAVRAAAGPAVPAPPTVPPSLRELEAR